MQLRAAINNAYYAMVHASHEISASKGIFPPKTRKGLRELLGRETIKTDLLEKEFGKHLNKAFQVRQVSAYNVYATYRQELSKMEDNAEKFIKRISDLLKTPQM